MRVLMSETQSKIWRKTDSLLSATLAPWPGPALLAYNDVVFMEEDFVIISRIDGSSKHLHG